MHFHKPEVARRVALDRWDLRYVQTGLQHGFAHGHAIGVGLLQPGRVKVAGERACAQKRGPVALAFFLRKGHDFQTERQAPLRPVHGLHARQRHVNAQPSVVLTAVAHRVVVAAGEQRRCVGTRTLVAPDHIAHGVDVHAVATGVTHVLHDARSTGAVCVG